VLPRKFFLISSSIRTRIERCSTRFFQLGALALVAASITACSGGGGTAPPLAKNLLTASAGTVSTSIANPQIICPSCGTPSPRPSATPSPRPTATPGIFVDMRDYITQPLNSNMLCTQSQSQCFTSFLNTSTGEFETIYDARVGIHDYTGIGPNVIGVIRSRSPQLGLRCFANTSQYCGSPPNSTMVPEAMPVTYGLNIVPASYITAAENADGSPSGHIFQARSPEGSNNTPGTYVPFANNTFTNAGCSQSLGGWTYAETEAVYATAVNFGGTVGVQDAVVIDEYELGPTTSQNHMERYFYVHGYGRVREGSSGYDTANGLYDLGVEGHARDNEVRSVLLPRDYSKIPNSPTECPQGSTVSMQR
jgi:hypothetical protein